jgi:putative two-component system response regulator
VKILAVDDEALILDILTRTLEASGHEVVTANSGREAIEVLRSGTDIQVVISDWVMPEVDGIDLCKWIRLNRHDHYVYIILLTGKAGDNRVVEALQAGADEFIAKPFDFDELQMRVRTAERILAIETRHLAIFALAKLAESRDPETGTHLERIREYCRLVAESLAESGTYSETVVPAFIDTVFQTSPLHDIGKVGIPDYILLKPGRLTDEEFDVMKTHTTIGSATLDAAVDKYPAANYLRIARDIVLTHHERYNGSGYPNARKGEDIPLCGRIVALADVYDALTSKRVYKEAVTHDIARNLIVNERGEHFDPAIVDAFIACESEFRAISTGRMGSEGAAEREADSEPA